MARAIVFAYHNVGVRCLSVLLAHGVDVALVVTHPDNPAEEIWFASVADRAREAGIPVVMPADANAPEFIAQLAALQPDFIFSFYYRAMLSDAVLATAARGAYNMHGSLLPHYRGRVPVNWAVLHGETRTGASLHRMVSKPDAGDLVAQQAVPILPDDTAFEVFGKVTVAAEMALDACLPALLAGRADHVPLDLRAGSYFGGRRPEDGRIDWQQPAQAIHNLIRAVAPPYPGAFCGDGANRLILARSRLAGRADWPPGQLTLVCADRLQVRCTDGVLLELLQIQGTDGPLTAAVAQPRLEALLRQAC